MPIYEYACRSCGHKLETLQKMSDAPLRDCPGCGQPGLEKMMSASGFVLKGGGWYATDFKDKGKRQENNQENRGENKEDKKETKKEDKKEDKKDGGGSAAPAASNGAAG